LSLFFAFATPIGVSPEFPSDNPDLWHAREPSPSRYVAPESESEVLVEIVDFSDDDFAAAVEEPAPPAPLQAVPEDPFQVFVRTLGRVSLAAGAPLDLVGILPGMLGAARLDVQGVDTAMLDRLIAGGLLGRTESGAVIRDATFLATAQAWRATLLGEQPELSVSTMLDEWAAHIVATLAASPEKKEVLRRQLRSNGIAAFGMIIEAA
jgi:hypothetical protein